MSNINSSQDTNHNPAKRPVNHAARHAPVRSKILRREAVKRPGPSLKRQIKAQGELGLSKQTLSDLSVGHTDVNDRLKHTKHVPKSSLISHFSAIKNNVPSYVTPAGPLRKPALVNDIISPTPLHHSSRTPSTTANILERGLRAAKSHEQKPLKRSHAHVKKQLSVVVVVTLAVGALTVVAAQSLNGAQLQVASAKAGFSAKLPNFKPAGFSQTAINSGRGMVAAQFQSNGDGRNYTITQKASSWDSTDLRDNFVAATDPNYQTLAANGLTIYIYGNHNGTWVNNGIWYDVQANGALSDHQLVELATSL